MVCLLSCLYDAARTLRAVSCWAVAAEHGTPPRSAGVRLDDRFAAPQTRIRLLDRRPARSIGGPPARVAAEPRRPSARRLDERRAAGAAVWFGCILQHLQSLL